MNILTTAQKSNEAIQEEAKALASSMHMAYIKRGKLSIPALLMLIHVILLLFFLVMA